MSFHVSFTTAAASFNRQGIKAVGQEVLTMRVAVPVEHTLKPEHD